MTGVACPTPILQFFDNNGNPNVGGSILTQVGGVNATCYQDSGLTLPLPDPIPLNSRGEVSNASGLSCQLFLTPNQVYTFTIFDANGHQMNQALYVNGVQLVLSQSTIGAVLYPRTPTEIAANVLPVNFVIPPYPIDPRRYGGVGDGVTNDAPAVQSALTVAATAGGVVKIYDGLNFLCTQNINAQCATTGFGVAPFAPDIEGSGWTNWGITFSGAAVTTGLTYTGGAGAGWAGSIRNIAIRCIAGAQQAVTWTNCTKPMLWQCFIYGPGTGVAGSGGRAVFADQCIMPVIEKTLFANWGTSTLYAVEIDRSTTFQWIGSYVSGGSVGSIGGLAIDRSAQSLLHGGAIESCGTPLAISCKVSSTIGCTGVTVQATDFENPGNGNRYIDVGSAVTGGNFVESLIFDGWTGFSSGTTNQPSAVRLQNTLGAELRLGQFSLLGASGAATVTIASPGVVSFTNTFAANQPVIFSTTGALPTGLVPGTIYYVSATGLSGASFQVSATVGGGSITTTGSQSGVHSINATIASYELAGTNNVAVHIPPQRNQYGAAYPWVTVNGVQVKAAGPSYDWVQGDSPKGLSSPSTNISGANPSILILAAQGGYFGVCGVTNGGATTMVTLGGGEAGMQANLLMNDANTTFQQGTGANQLSLLTGANTAAGANKGYSFIHNGTCWVQH